METMRKIPVLAVPIVMVLVLALVLAGCGGGGSSGSATGTSGSGSTSQANTSSSETKSVWETIRETGIITVGNSPDYEPFEFEDGQGNVVGFDIDLLGLICEELGIEYELVNLAFENIETAVQTGQVNIGMSCFSITPEREQTFDFTIPYFSGGQAIAVNPDSGIETIADLVGKTITAGMGTSGMEAAEEHIPDADVIGMEHYALAFMQLKSQGCDAAVADLPVVRKYAERDGFVVLDEILSYEDNAILVRKGNDDLLAALNSAIQSLKDDGRIDGLVEHWLAGEG